MTPKKEQQLAQLLLDHREKGYAVGYLIRQSTWCYPILLILWAGAFTYCLLTKDIALIMSLMTVGGFFIGAILRDLMWIMQMQRTWPFNRKVIDWNRVERIARGEEYDSFPDGPGHSPADRLESQ